MLFIITTINGNIIIAFDAASSSLYVRKITQVIELMSFIYNQINDEVI